MVNEMSSEYWYLQNVFLFLYYCYILLETKLTTTTNKINKTVAKSHLSSAKVLIFMDII